MPQYKNYFCKYSNKCEHVLIYNKRIMITESVKW